MIDKKRHMCYNKKKEVKDMYVATEGKINRAKVKPTRVNVVESKELVSIKNRLPEGVAKAIALAEYVNSCQPFERNPRIEMLKDDLYYEILANGMKKYEKLQSEGKI